MGFICIYPVNIYIKHQTLFSSFLITLPNSTKVVLEMHLFSKKKIIKTFYKVSSVELFPQFIGEGKRETFLALCRQQE